MTDESWLILVDPTPKRILGERKKDDWQFLIDLGGSHPEEKFGQRAMDPTPKKNKGVRTGQRKKIDRDLNQKSWPWFFRSWPQSSPQQQQQQQQHLPPFYDLSASPQVKMSLWALTVQCGLVGSLTRVQTEKEKRQRKVKSSLRTMLRRRRRKTSILAAVVFQVAFFLAIAS